MILKSNKLRCGLALVAVLWLTVLLGAIVAIVGRNSRLDTKMGYAERQVCQAVWASRAGVNTALAVLASDGRASDGLGDLWSENDTDFNDVEIGRCIFDVEVFDEASKLNLNTATKEELLVLEGMTEEIADSVLDWRDKNDSPRPSGAEGGYYLNLRYGYKIRNGRFGTVGELLLVKGVSDELLYGDDTRWVDYLTCYSADRDKDSAGNNRVNINTANEQALAKKLEIKRTQAKWIVDNRPKGKGYSSIGDLVNDKSPKEAGKDSKSEDAEALDLESFYRIVDKITVRDNRRVFGRVNINTAERVVLSALFGGGESAEGLADEIVSYRQGLVDGMESIGDLRGVGSMTIDKFKKVADKITTRSDVYLIRSIARAHDWDGGGVAIEAVVDRSPARPRVLYRHQGFRSYRKASGGNPYSVLSILSIRNQRQ